MKMRSDLFGPLCAVAILGLHVGGARGQDAAAKDSFGGGGGEAIEDTGGGAVARNPLSSGDAAGSDHDPFGGEAHPPAESVDLVFPAGTLAQLVEVVKHVFKDPPNIIVPPESADAMIPDLELKGVQFYDLLMIVSDATRGGSQVSFNESAAGIWVLEARPARPGPKSELAVFSAGNLLNGRSVDDLMAVIEKAFLVAAQGQVPQFHLHEETSVLMALLTKDQKVIVEQLFEVLERPTADGDDQRERKRAQVEDELQRLRAQLEHLSIELVKAQDRHETASQADAQRMAVGVRLLQNEVDLIERQMGSYMELQMRMRAQELGLETPARAATRHAESAPSRAGAPRGF